MTVLPHRATRAPRGRSTMNPKEQNTACTMISFSNMRNGRGVPCCVAAVGAPSGTELEVIDGINTVCEAFSMTWSGSILFVKFRVKFPESRCTERSVVGSAEFGIVTANAQIMSSLVSLFLPMVKDSTELTGASLKGIVRIVRKKSFYFRLPHRCQGLIRGRNSRWRGIW